MTYYRGVINYNSTIIGYTSLILCWNFCVSCMHHWKSNSRRFAGSVTTKRLVEILKVTLQSVNH
jgi:hypothetical protein